MITGSWRRQGPEHWSTDVNMIASLYNLYSAGDWSKAYADDAINISYILNL